LVLIVILLFVLVLAIFVLLLVLGRVSTTSIRLSIGVVHLSLNLAHLGVVEVGSLLLILMLLILLALMKLDLVLVVSKLIVLSSSIPCEASCLGAIWRRIEASLNLSLLLLLEHLVLVLDLLHLIIEKLVESFLLLWTLYQLLIRDEPRQDFTAPSRLQLVIIDFVKTNDNVINQQNSLFFGFAIIINAILKHIVSKVALDHLVQINRFTKLIDDFILYTDWCHVNAHLDELR